MHRTFSNQEEVIDELETFAQAVYINLILASLKRTLNEDELNLLQLAAQLADPGAQWAIQLAGEAQPRA